MTLSLSAQRAADPVARLGNSHGYSLHGDFAQLNAEILCDESRLIGQEWALQLWTDEGIKMAELALGLLQPNGTGHLQVSGTTAALPPAGEGPRIVSMLLVSGFGGQFDRIEDVSSYVQPMQFVQPRLRGTVCSGFFTDEITFDIARIENPRADDNLSGTLSLELWSLDTPYAGGAWIGVPVASLILGTLAGQQAWTDCHFTAHAGPLPAAGYLTLMLREWTPAGYITRDFRTLGRPGSTSVAATSDAADTLPASGAPAAKAAAPVPQTTAKPGAKPAAKPASKAAKKGDKAAGAASPVSVNTATATQLSSVKGLSDAVAAAIVAARPYASLDDVVRAKGMGQKLLEKARAGLKL